MTVPVRTASRREQNKVVTRDALRVAAHRLFADQGFTRTTIDEITDAAGVSRRTFFRYYSSKDDLIRFDMADLLPALVQAIQSRPLDEPPLMSILAGLRALAGPDRPPALLAGLAAPTAGIRARIGLLRLLAHWEQAIADTLVIRWGLVGEAGADEAARRRAAITAAAATSALRSSVSIYRESFPGPGLDPDRIVAIIEDAFAVLAGGCSAPEVAVHLGAD